MALNIFQGSFIKIIIESGTLSLTILSILILMSVISWGLIFKKWIHFTFAIRAAKQFLESVDLHKGLSEIMYRAEFFPNTYTARLFQSAYSVFSRQFDNDGFKLNNEEHQKMVYRIERTIEKQITDQNADMEKGLSALASISSSAPFIGLFGTVIGIIDAFYSIGAQGSSNIAVVAPGISAALVATAFGLFTAIPALMAYNLFRDKTRFIANQMRSFGLELLDWLTEDINVTTE